MTDLAIVDEFGAHKDYSLYEVCRSSQTYKLNSNICAITTAYPNVTTSPAYTERCILVDMYEGKIPMDDRYFCALYELDEDDDYTDVSVWGKANPLFVQFPEIMKKLEERNPIMENTVVYPRYYRPQLLDNPERAGL